MRDEHRLELSTLIDRDPGRIVCENERCFEITDVSSGSNRVKNDTSSNAICSHCGKLYCEVCFNKSSIHQCESKIIFHSNRILSQLDNTQLCQRCKLQQATCHCRNCNSHYFCQSCIHITHSTGKFILHHIIPLKQSLSLSSARKVIKKTYQNQSTVTKQQIDVNQTKSQQYLATRMQLTISTISQKKSQLKLTQLQVREKIQNINGLIDRMFKQLHQRLTDKHQTIKQSISLHSSTITNEIASILSNYNLLNTDLMNLKTLFKDRLVVGQQQNIEKKLRRIDESADTLQIKVANLLVKNDNLRFQRQLIDSFKQRLEEDICTLIPQACMTTAKYIVAGQDTETLSKSKSNLDLSSFSNKKKSSIKSFNNPSCYNYNSSIKGSNKKSDNGMTIKKNITLSQNNGISNTNKSTICNNNNNNKLLVSNNMNARPKRRNISIELCQTDDNCQLQKQQQRTTTQPSNDDRRIKQLNRIKSFDLLSKNIGSVSVVTPQVQQNKMIKKQAQCKRISLDDYFKTGDQKIELLSPQSKISAVDNHRDISEFSFIRNSKLEGESVIQEVESIHFLNPSTELFPQIEKVETARPIKQLTQHSGGIMMMNSPKANCTINGKQKPPPSTPSTKHNYNKTFSSINTLKSPTNNKPITQAFKSPKVKIKYPNQNKNETLNYLSQSNLKRQTATKTNLGGHMLANG